MKKKIAFIHNLPNGGGLRMLTEIVNRYKSNCEIDVFSISNIPQKKMFGVNNIQIKIKPWNGFIFYNLWLIFVLPIIHKEISKKYKWEKYNFVFVTHDYFTKSPYIIRYLKNKIIYLCQEPQREFYESWNIHAPFLKDKIANILRYPIKIIDINNVKHVSLIFCNSKYSKNIIQKIYKKKCEIVYPGVNNKIFSPANIKKKDYILCIGTISTVKGQAFIINSLKSLLNKYRLMFIGNGRKEDVEYLKKIIKKTKTKKIFIINKVTDKKLVNYYRRAMVTCIAAYNEPFGLSSIESQACGTPVVTVSDGGPKESIINGNTGYISKRNEKEFLIKTEKIINKVNTMKFNCVKNILNNWTWDKTLKPLDKYFLEK